MQLYAEVFKTGEKVVLEAMKELGFDDETRGSENLVALNTLPWARSEMVKMPIVSEKPKYCLGTSDMGIGSVQPLSAATPATASIKETKKGVYELDNSRFKVEIADGVITSLYDKTAKREVIAKGGKANQLVIFDDKPLYWQAWDVEVFHLESRKELTPSSSKILESGPHRVSVVTETRISEESWAKTTISLSATADDNSAAVEIEAEVEWKESMKFLKVEFPVDIVNTEASYETQYGIVRRPTHYNTTWDMAKFEVCCHKWADLSESGYGVSILNDSKYGFATVGNLMRLSLLRAPKAPDAHADMGMLLILTIRSWELLMI
jgi:alpha-mannosidase